MFYQPLQQEEAVKRLLTLRQGGCSVMSHTLELRTTAARTGWGKVALQGTFLDLFSNHITDHLADRE